jgi:hypothetical protein
MAFSLRYIYIYIRLYNKIVQQQAGVIQNHENELFPSTIQGEARHRKYKGLNLAVVKLTTVQVTKLPLFPPPPRWRDSPILGLDRLNETFRLISVTTSRTVGRTPWTGDQLVAGPLQTAPGDFDDREVGGMNGFGRGNRSTRGKPAPTPLCSLQIALARPGREPWEASD